MDHKINFASNQIKDHLTATLRAMVADESLGVEFLDVVADDFFTWNHSLVTPHGEVSLPKLRRGDKKEDDCVAEFNDVMAITINHSRSSSDMAAAYLLFHKKEQRLANDFSPEENQIFDGFERVRVISNIASQYRGAMQNILAKIESDINSGFGDLSLILLQFL